MTKGLVMFLCRDLRSCHTITVNLIQPRRVSRNLFAPGGGPEEAMRLGWGGATGSDMETERPKGCRTADAEEMETSVEHSDIR